MEALVIITILFLVGLATWTGVTAHSNSVTIAKYRRQFDHQKDELRKAALINARLRAERDALMEMCVKYKRAAEDNKPAQFNKELLTTLIMLCHPDKHGGKESATRMTQVLIKLKETLK